MHCCTSLDLDSPVPTYLSKFRYSEGGSNLAIFQKIVDFGTGRRPLYLGRTASKSGVCIRQLKTRS